MIEDILTHSTTLSGEYGAIVDAVRDYVSRLSTAQRGDLEKQLHNPSETTTIITPYLDDSRKMKLFGAFVGALAPETIQAYDERLFSGTQEGEYTNVTYLGLGAQNVQLSGQTFHTNRMLAQARKIHVSSSTIHGAEFLQGSDDCVVHNTQVHNKWAFWDANRIKVANTKFYDIGGFHESHSALVERSWTARRKSDKEVGGAEFFQRSHNARVLDSFIGGNYAFRYARHPYVKACEFLDFWSFDYAIDPVIVDTIISGSRALESAERPLIVNSSFTGRHSLWNAEHVVGHFNNLTELEDPKSCALVVEKLGGVLFEQRSEPQNIAVFALHYAGTNPLVVPIAAEDLEGAWNEENAADRIRHLGRKYGRLPQFLQAEAS